MAFVYQRNGFFTLLVVSEKRMKKYKLPAQVLLLGNQAMMVVFMLALLQANIGKAIAQTPVSGSANQAQIPKDVLGPDCATSDVGSPYIPADNWIYDAVNRLYALGYAQNVYLGLRPWTRTGVLEMLDLTETYIRDAEMYDEPTAEEARLLYQAIVKELNSSPQTTCQSEQAVVRIESVYSLTRAMSGEPLRDSFHLGSTIVNDYGRPYSRGVNNYSGASGYATAGRFVLYARGEFQGTPTSSGYSTSLANQLTGIDGTTYFFNPNCWNTESPTNTACSPMPLGYLSSIPLGPTSSKTRGRFLEAYISAQYYHHIFSFGKQDFWQSPAKGASMSYSTNAENLYSFRINRIEPMYIPFLSRLTGPFRYEFMVGPLRGHKYPIDPWVHLEKISLRPTVNLEFGFERTAIWGGRNHVPITVKSFLKSFFSLSAPEGSIKNSSADPGARFGAFDFSYRLPFVRNWLTLYSDGEVHDDVSPIDAPRRASWRPGLYLSHTPGVPKLDFRVEAAWTDPPIVNSSGGKFMYWEGIQRQGYSNDGQIFGDWIGREAKGGQAWLTYHLSGNEWIQAGMRHHKVAKDFIPGGTTLNDLNVEVVKRIKHDLELKGNFTFEQYKAPIYLPGKQTVTVTTFQLTWYPERKVSF